MPYKPEYAFDFLDTEASIKKSGGTSLPHWQQQGVIYFVTFRLADSLPARQLEKLREEKSHWLKTHPNPQSQAGKKEYARRFTEQTEIWLDQGFGSMLLGHPDAAQIVENALLHFHRTRYWLDTYAIASNHVHVLVAPREPATLSEILQSWKGFTARTLGKLATARSVSTFPTIWQKESFDHIVRSEKSLQRFRKYILSHPTRFKESIPR